MPNLGGEKAHTCTASVALPKAIEKMSTELGGLSALQREGMSWSTGSSRLVTDWDPVVMSIVASPTLSSDVRHKATGLLRQVYDAYSSDKAGTKQAAAAGAGAGAGAAGAGVAASGTGTAATAQVSHAHTDEVPTFTPPASRNINTDTQAEARALEAELDYQQLDDKVEETPVSTDEILRVHGIYMSQRRHFEIRVDHTGRLVLWDAKEGKVWGT